MHIISTQILTIIINNNNDINSCDYVTYENGNMLFNI